MKITKEDVLHMGKLSKIAPTEKEVAKLEKQFGEILGYMDRLNEVNTNGVPPLYSPLDFAPATKPDEVRRTCSRDELLSNSPEESREFFVVPRII